MIHLESLERALRLGLRGLLLLAALVALAGPFWLALGTDEAWILSSLLGLSRPVDPEMVVNATFTSGGPFAAIHGGLQALGVTAPWAHRLLTLGVAAASVVLACRLIPARPDHAAGGGSADERLLIVAGVAAAPGALTLAGLAHAEWMSTALALLTVLLWDRTEGRPSVRILGCGLSLGLAMATRSPAIALAPGLLLWAGISGPGWRIRLRDSLGVLILAGVVLALCIAGFTGMAATSARPEVVESLSVMGLTGWMPNYPRLLNRWIVGERILPVAWLAAVTVAAAFWGARRREEPLPSWTLLIAFAWSVWLLWMIRAPIAHLRYLWPGLGALGAATGITLALMYRAGSERAGARVACLALSVAFLIGPLASGFRHLVNGHTDLVMWEWSGQSALSYARRFQHVADQHDAADWLRTHVPASEDVAVFSQPFALRYLSEQRVRAHWEFLDATRSRWSEERPRWVVLQPHNHAFRYLSPEARAWMETSCELRAEFGSYAIYRVSRPWPDDPAPFRLQGRPEERFPGASPRFGAPRAGRKP